ncbi:MAG TPA: Rieske 2Fe-2S domain-containing protein [Stellaceae bacterium]|nr:Rieske 2Fe-2S domain-containing protein [Stellaceae bacterium]
MAWKRLCALGDVAENALRKFEVDGVPVVAALVEGEVMAYPPLCPHMAEPLEISGICDGGTLTCTKHLWQWDMKSGGELGLAEKPLLLYPVKREGDAVLIDIEQELVYDYD